MQDFSRVGVAGFELEQSQAAWLALSREAKGYEGLCALLLQTAGPRCPVGARMEAKSQGQGQGLSCLLCMV